VTMAPGLRKLVLTVHVTVSVGWLGAVVAYLVPVIAALRSQDAPSVRAAWMTLEITGQFAIVPLAIAALLSGLLQALGTEWGLFRHYWVLFKLMLTGMATAILVLHMPTVSFFAEVARDPDRAILGGLQSELLHAGGGLLVLFVTTILAVYKPRGLTPYGWRKLHERRTAS
jgi:hypothetical protein